MIIYAKIGSSFFQQGGECPEGFIKMNCDRPTPSHIAKECGEWVLPEQDYKELRKAAILAVWPETAQLEAFTEAAVNRPEKRDQLLAFIQQVKIDIPKC